MTAPSLDCSVCQRGPARVFSIRRHVGMVLLQRFVKLRVPLCRDHALEITKAYLGKTLWQGWWGYISVFVNVFVVVADLVVLAQARGMEPPRDQPALHPGNAYGAWPSPDAASG